MFEGNHHHFFGTLNMLIADNLAVHATGGYFCNFSTVHQFCRSLNCRKNQLEQCLPIKTFTLRTKTGYEDNIAALGTNPSYSSLYGLKENSCLNELSYYHVTSGLPPHLAHDFFEGVAIDRVIIHYVQSGYLTLESFNDIIRTFFYTDADKSNKPQPVKIKPLNQFRVKQTASEMWNLLRLLPLMIAHLIPENDECWQTFLKFLQVEERFCSSYFSSSGLAVLDSDLHDFIKPYFEVFEDAKLKPKSLYLQHYPQMIKAFGTLVKILSFESKHGYFKSTFSGSKNRKNICYSLVKRHQMHLYRNYKKANLLEHCDPQGKFLKELPLESLETHIQETLNSYLNVSRGERLSKSKGVLFEGQVYAENDVVVTDFASDEPLFGYIDSIWHYNGDVFVLCDMIIIRQFDCHYNSYKNERSGLFEAININALYDYHPLSIYKNKNRFLLPLKRFISDQA